MKRTTGEFVPGSLAAKPYRAFIPNPLPPDPPLAFDAELETLRNQAHLALGRLDMIGALLPDSHLFLYQYVRKEALLSSQIEGTQSSYTDLLLSELQEAPGMPLDDVREVSNYVAALDHGLERIREGFPLSLRLLREMHAILLARGRGEDKLVGDFRRIQVFIANRAGESVFVPPPPDRLMACLDPFEHFLHEPPERIQPLLKAALAHVQFESIHPFEDGNGRLGRQLIPLLLCENKMLAQPNLYLSLFFKSHRDEYYDRLQRVRTEGDWEGWVRFFLLGVRDTADQAVVTAQRLRDLFRADQERIEGLRRVAGTALRVHELLRRRPIMSVPEATRELGLSFPAVAASFGRLVDLGAVREITGRQRNRLFAYQAYLDILIEGTEPLPPVSS